jgi:hypothetical protein
VLSFTGGRNRGWQVEDPTGRENRYMAETLFLDVMSPKVFFDTAAT